MPVETIERIAREFAYTKPATTYTYRGPAKHLYGSYNEKACMMLPIMTGNVEVQGGYCLPRGMSWPQPQPAPPKPAKGSYLAHPDEYPLAAHKVEPPGAVLDRRGQAEDQRLLHLQDNPVYTNPGSDAVWGKMFRDEKLIPFLRVHEPVHGRGNGAGGYHPARLPVSGTLGARVHAQLSVAMARYPPAGDQAAR